ncbi:hypothetical protein N656DRAFT_783869 [Canariomyces notabilis]|uniref:F-box domain-containing protein n=1 Tax=Canariomyces notabilis TaxID=2074819 RepID=A0AAN6T8X6_9PEZI|nr:hypothetical protein N656DRAFT_783869 [Canariomyces arenarius]
MAPTMPPGYLSATECYFRNEEAEAIVRTVGYHCEDYSRGMLWFPRKVHVGIRPSIATPFQRTPTTGLGFLDRLPLELLHDVWLRLDMRSLFNLRQVNIRARETVDALNQYQLVVSYGLNLFCALLRTQLASGISLSDFYDALCKKNCALCGEFAGFMSLLTWTRCCFACLEKAPELEVQSLASVRKTFHLRKGQLAQLKSFKTLPGIYWVDSGCVLESVRKSRTTVVSAHQARLLFGQQLHTPAQEQETNWDRRSSILRYTAACELAYYDKSTGKVENGICCAGCQLALEKRIIGSWGEDWSYEARNKSYARDGLLGHFRWCKQAQLLWESSGGGKRRPPELPAFAWRGSFFKDRE